MLNAPVKEILFDNNAAIGVEVEKEGKRVRVRAKKGVMLAAGGFPNNESMRKRYHRPPVSTEWTVAVSGNTGEVIEMPNPYPTPESLYRLCDEEYMYETFKDDIMVHIIYGQREGIEVDVERLEHLAETLSVKTDFRSPDTLPQAARALHLACALLFLKYLYLAIWNVVESSRVQGR